jgi:hypothetical protein
MRQRLKSACTHIYVRMAGPLVISGGLNSCLPSPDRVVLVGRRWVQGVGRGSIESLLESVTRCFAPHLDKGFGAYLRFFGEGSA